MTTIIGALPYNLVNGTTADATQVMANYNAIVNNVNANAAGSGANNDITSILGLTTPLSVSQGGTGVTTVAAIKALLSLGAAAAENLANNIVDDGAGNLVVKANSITGAMLLTAGIVIPNGSTATTQAALDNSLNLGTTAYTDAAVAAEAAILNARMVKGTPLVMNPYAFPTAVSGAHGLSGAPNTYVAYLTCLTAEGGYSIGDIMPVGFGNFGDGTGACFAISFNATTTTISTPNYSTLFPVVKGGTNDFSLTPANWSLTVIPYKMN